MITIRCLIDNSVLRGSSLWGEHGVSFLVETQEGRVLMDCGQSGEVLLHNAKKMKIDLAGIDALVLSHAHYDHTGGLSAFLSRCRDGLCLYANRDIFRPRYAIRDGQATQIGLRVVQEELVQRVRLNLSEKPTEVLPGVWTSGEIQYRGEFEGRSAQHHIQVDGEWRPDPYLDDLSMVIEIPKGLILLCGCCHAGLLNTLAQIRRSFAAEVLAIIGGTHLTGATPEMLDRTAAYLNSLNQDQPPALYLNHCTGESAWLALNREFGARVQLFPAGSAVTF